MSDSEGDGDAGDFRVEEHELERVNKNNFDLTQFSDEETVSYYYFCLT